ncbi:FecCD family ABC transporter permease [Methanomassiliicoccus luminyensis]|uniref:FecCD family ABC transporter permease n=1 Tax=Methanomassiliicoccus luminyensis TaxID=1080712 RepID=UPI00037CE9CC|nr:iron ABC transporter permease [Methanomassiliicoccus luminyensis]
MYQDFEDFKKDYTSRTSRKVLFALIVLALAFVVFGITISVGEYPIGFLESYQIVFDRLLGNPASDRMKDIIIWNYRLPRAIMAALAGSGLAIGGAVMQSALRNPLAEPYTMGISSGASLGAALSIISGICIIPSITGESATIINAFALSLIPVAVILLVIRFKKTTPTMMILSGIAVMYVFSAVTTMLMVVADPTSLSEVYQWRVGTLGKASWDNIPIVLIFVAAGIAALWYLSRNLNILAMGNKGATSLGVNTNRLMMASLVVVALVTSAIVCFTGTIGFVGLIVPHMVRIFIGSNNKYLIPTSACFGALFLMVMDSIAKVAGQTGLPVGVICAVVGGPTFIYVLIKQKKSAWK